MTFDEIKQLYETTGPVGIKLCAHDINLNHMLYGICRDIPDALPYLNHTVSAWSVVMYSEPKFASLCPILDQFTSNDWSVIVGLAPANGSICPWDKLTGASYVGIVIRQPQFLKDEYLHKLDKGDWLQLLRNLPDLSNDPKIPWADFTGYDWYNLIDMQPRFHGRCEWLKLTAYHWSWLLDAKDKHFATLLHHFRALPVSRIAELCKAEPTLEKYKQQKTKKKKNT